MAGLTGSHLLPEREDSSFGLPIRLIVNEARRSMGQGRVAGSATPRSREHHNHIYLCDTYSERFKWRFWLDLLWEGESGRGLCGLLLASDEARGVR